MELSDLPPVSSFEIACPALKRESSRQPALASQITAVAIEAIPHVDGASCKSLLKPHDSAHDPVGCLAAAFRECAHSSKDFRERVESVSGKTPPNLPGMPWDQVFDYVKASVDPKAPDTIARLVKSQAHAVLLRCKTALAMNSGQKGTLYPTELILDVIQLVWSWVDEVVTEDALDTFVLPLTTIYWERREDPLLKGFLEGYASYDDFFDEYVERASSPARALFAFACFSDRQPSPHCLEALPAALLSYYSLGNDLSDTISERSFLTFLKDFFKRGDLCPPVMQACLLYLLPSCEIKRTYTFQNFYAIGFFRPLIERLYLLTSSVISGRESTNNLAISLVHERPRSPAVMTALLLLFVEELEKAPWPSINGDQILKVLYLLPRILLHVRQLPPHLQSRISKSLFGLFQRLDAIFSKQYPERWEKYKLAKLIDRNPQVCNPYHLLNASSTFLVVYNPLKLIVHGLGKDSLTEAVAIFRRNFSMLRDDFKEVLLSGWSVLGFFAFVEVDEEAEEELTSRDAASFLMEKENLPKFLGNPEFRRLLYNRAEQLLVKHFPEV